MNTKSALRHHYLELRQSLSFLQQEQAKAQIEAQFLKHIPLEKGDIIAGYVPIRGEVNVLKLLQTLFHQGYRCALPSIEHEESLVFREWKKEDILVEQKPYRIVAPLPSATPLIPTHILTPLLAFDQQGHRLGYGKGWYDRTASALRHRKIPFQMIGIAYDVQFVNELPCDAMDERLDNALTETRFFHF